mmetsp:Transcript_35575/g.52225  ORF Transcript_35575/g.52225 Transcript_35575/m.52225 type:complete len:257 (-) Transcript_35575:53-823(-)
MAGAYDGDMASAPRPIQAATNPGYVTVHVVSPQGDKHPLKVRPADDIATLRALCTQMFDTQDWTTVADKREDRQEYSDILDEDTGFSEVIALQANPESRQQSFMDRFSGRPRTWLEWADKKGKLRLMCGAYTLEDGKTLDYYHIKEGSIIHPLYERYGDTLDASAAMLIDPSWYKQQVEQAKTLANEMSGWEWKAPTAPACASTSFVAPSFAVPSAPSWGGFGAGSAGWSSTWTGFGGAASDDSVTEGSRKENDAL